MPARFEFSAQFHVIVNLAVADDVNRSVLVRDRLLAAVEIDNAQPPHRQADAGLDEEAFIIRSAMAQRVGHFAEEGTAISSVFRGDVAGDAAHSLPLRFWARGGKPHLVPLVTTMRASRLRE